MARPSFWLRFFGPNGPTTLAELRDALITGLPGPELADGRFLARIQGVLNLPDRTGAVIIPSPGQSSEPGLYDRAGVPAATLSGLTGAIPALDGPSSTLTLGTGPLPAADPNDSRLFIIQAGNDEQPTALRRSDLELIYPIGTDPQLLAQLAREEASTPSGSWTKIFTSHDYAAIAASAEGLANYRAEYDASGFAALKASGEGRGHGADTLSLSGDFSAGFTLSDLGGLGRVSLGAGSDYVLISDEDFVHGGTMMIVDGSKVGADNHVMFDGSAETDGCFCFFGGAGNDIVFGGAGNDWLCGLGGADTLTGGGGADTFVYSKANESSGVNYDVLADFDPLADRIDLVGKVTGFDATIQTGSLSDGSFSHDLAGALAGLGANHAALFRPDSGDLAETVFLVVDANGVAGYQEGEDYVFALPATTLADLAGHTDFFV